MQGFRFSKLLYGYVMVRQGRSIVLSKEKYISDNLKKFNMGVCTPKTPMVLSPKIKQKPWNTLRRSNLV